MLFRTKARLCHAIIRTNLYDYVRSVSIFVFAMVFVIFVVAVFVVYLVFAVATVKRKEESKFKDSRESSTRFKVNGRETEKIEGNLCTSLSLYLSLSLPFLSICLSVCLSICLSICLSLCLSVCQSTYGICLPIYHSV
jgi:hypothetical protein